jgi:DNA polymerase-3 subunit delta'
MRDSMAAVFEEVVEQAEAKRLLQAALAEGPAHAYLFHGPAGVGKRKTALAFAGELLGDRGRVERQAHPDLYVLEPLGDMIRIDEIRTLRRDLHMRPFEAAWRVYLIVSAHLLNTEAADALLKDLEEPPEYAVIVLLADELGPLPETIRSRCQLISFSRLSERAVRAVVDAWAPGLPPERATAVARVAGGRLDRAERLLDADAAARREELLSIARSVYADPGFSTAVAAGRVLELVNEGAEEAKERVGKELEWLDLTEREADLRRRRTELGAQREGVLEALEELAAWYRDLICVAVGAENVVAHYDHLPQLTEDASPERLAGAERAVELVRETWRGFEELNLQPKLALEALLVQLRRELATAVPAPV